MLKRAAHGSGNAQVITMARRLSGRPEAPYTCVMDDLTLPPELERFAEEAVATGRFRDVSAVVAAGVSLLQRAEAERAAFIRSLEEAQAQAEREGWHELDDVLAEVDAIIDEEARARA